MTPAVAPARRNPAGMSHFGAKKPEQLAPRRESQALEAQLIWVPISANIAGDMKTTLDIASPLLKQAKQIARSQGTTLRALVERGLQLALSERRAKQSFKLRDASVDGKGLHPDVAGRSWDELRDMSYEGHGG